MPEADEDFEEAAGGIAFLMLGPAFAAAGSYRTLGRDEVIAVLHALRAGVTAELRQTHADRPASTRIEIAREARQQIQSVLRAAEGSGRGDGR